MVSSEARIVRLEPGGRAKRTTEVEVSGRLALACGGCGALLTLADRVVEDPDSARAAGG
jgi:hypothetical protein